MSVNGHTIQSPSPEIQPLPKGEPVTEPHQATPHLEEQHGEDVENHPLVIWASLSLGDVVSLRVGNQERAGTVESRTCDGLIIWIRDDLNNCRPFHFRECQSVHVIQ